MGDMSKPFPYAVNPLPFDGKVIAVTGASRGLGLALSKYLLVRGATVSNVLLRTTHDIYTDSVHLHVGLYVCNFS
jgi:NAD(P)-dependent dehydrogenase (short-subunit alcohol dehydrogenase family)